MPTLLAVSHGTDSARGSAAIAALVEQVAERLAHTCVAAAFVDVQRPDAITAVRAIDDAVVIVPLLLSTGFHVRVDLQDAAARHPHAVVAPPLGPDRRLADILAARTGDRPHHLATRTGDRPVILAAAGSRDPESAPACEQTAALLRERIDVPVRLAYLAARTPTLAETAAQHPDAVIVPYLLAHGFFHDLTVRTAPGHDVTAPLLDGAAVPSALVDVVIDRFEAAARKPE